MKQQIGQRWLDKQVTVEKTYEWDVDGYRKSPADKTFLDIFRK